MQASQGLLVQFGTTVAGTSGAVSSVYGPVSQADAQSLIAALGRGDDPGGADPLVPWAAAVVRNGEVAVTASTMLPSGIFWALDATGEGPVLTAATDPGSVVARRPVPTGLDAGWLRGFLDRVAPPDQTPYVGVCRLLPGHTLVWRPGSLPRQVQWCGPQAWGAAPRRRITVRTYRAMFDQVIGAVVAATPVLAAQVSGGLDSTFAVSTAAGSPLLRGAVQACVSAPLPQAAFDVGKRIADETPYVMDLAARYPGRVHVTRVVNTDLRQPLDAAAAASQASWMPAPNPANQVWIGQIRQIAAGVGAGLVLSGQYGNYAFSPAYPPSGWARRLKWRVRGTGLTVPVEPDPVRLARLACHLLPNPGVENPAGVAGILTADPFMARPLLDMAASITARQWGCEPWPRGFARRVAQGRVPDSIRLRVARGAQSPDYWWWIKDQRERYLDESAQLVQSEVAADLDVAALRAGLQAWPWGEPHGPSPRDISRIDEILSIAAFARSTNQRLRHMNSTIEGF